MHLYKSMKKKLLRIALVGKTNSGKSTLLNNIVGETISITNKKINTTQELTIGIINKKNVQLVFYDTPGFNFIKSIIKDQKKLKINLWQGINESDVILFVIDSNKFIFNNLKDQLMNINKLEKKIIFIFNKIDLIKKNKIPDFLKILKENFQKDTFFNISAKYNLGLNELIEYIKKFSKVNDWIYPDKQISNKDEIFLTNECTRNAILTYLHKELPYNIKIHNESYKLLKSGHLKIKQKLEINISRYRKIILGKNGETIKKIRESSQRQISKILNRKIHLYLEIIVS